MWSLLQTRWRTKKCSDTSLSAAESLTPGAAPASYSNWTGDVKLLTNPGAVARVSHRLRGRRATVRGETLPVVETAPRKSLISQGTMGRSSHLAPPTLLGEGNVWVVCNPEEPDFGKSMDLGGQSHSLGEYGLADRANGNFVVVKRRPLITVPSLLSDSINCLQRLKGSGDVSGREVHSTDASPKGRERLAEEPTVGEQAGESAEHEDVRTLWVSLDEHGHRWKEWKQVCREIQSHSFGDGWSESHEGPNCTLDLFRNWKRNGSDPVIWLSQFFKEVDIGSKERTAMELKTLVRCLWLSGVYDQLNAPNLCCLEEVARRVCQLDEAYESGAHGKPNWASVKWFTSVHSSSNMVPLPWWVCSVCRAVAQQKVAQHGRVLESNRFKRDPDASVRVFFQANDFEKGPDGLCHPRTEFEQAGLHSVWSQATDFPEVEPSLFEKRSWCVVISRKWRFGDDIPLREACAFFRGLEVVVCGTRSECTSSLSYRQHVLCPRIRAQTRPIC